MGRTATKSNRLIMSNEKVSKVSIMNGKVYLDGFVVGEIIRHSIPEKTIEYKVSFLGESKNRKISYQ